MALPDNKAEVDRRLSRAVPQLGMFSGEGNRILQGVLDKYEGVLEMAHEHLQREVAAIQVMFPEVTDTVVRETIGEQVIAAVTRQAVLKTKFKFSSVTAVMGGEYVDAGQARLLEL